MGGKYGGGAGEEEKLLLKDVLQLLKYLFKIFREFFTHSFMSGISSSASRFIHY